MDRPFAPHRFVALAAISVVHAAWASGLPPVTLGARTVAAGRIRTMRLTSLKSAPQLPAYGIVLDPVALTRQITQILSARSAVSAASAEAALAGAAARRATDLYRARQNISRAAMQRAQAALLVAEARYSRAKAHIAQARTRFLAHWGVKLTAASLTADRLVSSLEHGTMRIIEVSLPFGEALHRPPRFATAKCPDDSTLTLRFLSRAPRVSADTGGVSLFYLMPARNCAPIGTALAVTLMGSASQRGTLVPRSAVLWYRGKPWVFRETAQGSFAPVAIAHASSVGRKYFVPLRTHALLRAGERIVTHGTALLYSAALDSSVHVKSAESGGLRANRGR